jgi:hypothetical protein
MLRIMKSDLIFGVLAICLTVGMGTMLIGENAHGQSTSRSTARACFSRALYRSPNLNATEAAFLCRGAISVDGPLNCFNYGLYHYMNLDRRSLLCLCAGAEDAEAIQCYFDALYRTPGLSAQGALTLCSNRCLFF